MSHTDATKFLDAIETDETFARELEALKDAPDQLLDAARARGFVLEPGEVRDAFLERYGDDLTDEQLAAIAGGGNHSVFGLSLLGAPLLVAGAAAGF